MEPSKMRRVVVESPYAGNVERNVMYAKACIRDCLARGEAPIASHLLFTQDGILNDEIPEERQQGIDAGIAWHYGAHASVVYCDFGISMGMKFGIASAETAGIQVEYRSLGPAAVTAIIAGLGVPPSSYP